MMFDMYIHEYICCYNFIHAFNDVCYVYIEKYINTFDVIIVYTHLMMFDMYIHKYI